MIIRLFSATNSRLLQIGFLLIFSTRFLTWCANPRGYRQPDSLSYLPDSWLDFSRVSFSGNSSRSWVVPFFYAVLPNDSTRVLAQLIIGGVVWTLVILLTIRILNNSSLQTWVIIFEIFLAISPNVIQFESVLLATSLLLYSMLIFIMILVYAIVTQTYSIRILLITYLVGFVSVSLKLINLPIVIFFAVVLTFKYFTQNSALKRVVMVGIMCLLFTQATWSGLNNDKFWPNSYSGTALLWHLGNQSPSANEFKGYLIQSQAPECITRNAPYSDINEELTLISQNCEEAGEYLNSEIKNDFARFLVGNPKSSISLTTLGFAIISTSSASHYGGVVTVIPESLSEMFFGGVNPDFRISGATSQSAALNQPDGNEPLWISAPSFVLLAAGVISLLAYFRRNSFNRQLVFVLGFLYAQIILNIVILPSEWVRQNIQFSIPLYVMSSLIIALSYSSPIDERKRPVR